MMPIPDVLMPSLLAALPSEARRVLDLGCNLAQAIEQAPRPITFAPGWRIHAPSDLNELDTGYDTVVLGPLLGACGSPEALLELLHERCAPGARLVCVLPNAAHHSVVERLLMGDPAYDDAGLMPTSQTRLLTQASAFKLLLDAGWLPTLSDHADTDLPETAATARLLGTMVAQGLSREQATQQLSTAWMVVSAARQPASALLDGATPAGFAPFSVIVPVHNPLVAELDVMRSPGLMEVQADIVPVQGADSAAQAWAMGCAQTAHPWRLMLREDAYLPQGSGLAIAQQLARLEVQGLTQGPVGLFGLEAELDLRTGLRYAGQLVEPQQAQDHPGTHMAVALHDAAVALHASSPLQPDPELGWQLWATDLCLQQLKASGGASGGVTVQAPVFLAAARTAGTAPGLQASARQLLRKHQEWHRIPTLDGELQDSSGQ